MRILLLLLILLAITPNALALDRYQFQVDPDLRAVEVEACFDGKPPPSLHRHRDAAKYTQWLRLGNQRINSNRSRISLKQLAEGSCASWRVDLAAASRAGDYRMALTVDQALLTAGNLWLWRDDDGRNIEVRTTLPKGMQFSSPWLEIEPVGNSRRFRPANTPASWSSRLALGNFPLQQMDIGGTQLNLALLGNFNVSRQADMRRWIAEPAKGVADVIGHFPQQQPQILVVAISSRSSPVPWAHVVRGGGVAIELFIDATRPLSEFREDWTATHEFSHLLLPYVSSQDRWLSEGLASYYQNVLRARDGRLSETEAWKKLIGGLRRGEDSGYPGATMDTYWRGASILLQADAQLRAKTNGHQSLDTALALLNDCCYDADRSWRAREVLDKLDELTGHEVFGELYQRYARSTEFPDAKPTLEKLGVRTNPSGLQLDNRAPWSRIRRCIMKGSQQSAQGLTCVTH